MNLYHSWIYRQVINTEWFMWSVVLIILAINVSLPLIIWYAINGKRIMKKFRMYKGNAK